MLDPVPHVLTKTIGSSAEPPIDPGGRLVPDVIRCVTYGGRPHTVRKEIKCSGDLEILHKIVCATIRKLGKHELFRVLSRTISFSISKSPLTFQFLFTSVVSLRGQYGSLLTFTVYSN